MDRVRIEVGFRGCDSFDSRSNHPTTPGSCSPALLLPSASAIACLSPLLSDRPPPLSGTLHRVRRHPSPLLTPIYSRQPPPWSPAISRSPSSPPYFQPQPPTAPPASAHSTPAVGPSPFGLLAGGHHLLSIQPAHSPPVPLSVNIPMSRSKNMIVATGLLVFAAGGLSFPFLFVKSKNKPIIDSSKPLPPQATFRGPYVNSGSHDVGPDAKA